MTNETITLIAESAPFWGVATTIWTIAAVVVFGVSVWLSIEVEDPLAVLPGLAFGFIIFAAGQTFSVMGVAGGENASLQQQLQEVVHVENLDYNNKDFTGSIDGRYVKGTLVHIGGKEYQVVELVTEGSD